MVSTIYNTKQGGLIKVFKKKKEKEHELEEEQPTPVIETGETEAEFGNIEVMPPVPKPPAPAARQKLIITQDDIEEIKLLIQRSDNFQLYQKVVQGQNESILLDKLTTHEGSDV